MAGHTTGNGVNSVLYISAVFFENLTKLPNLMLSLGHCQAISWNKCDRISSFKNIIDIFLACRLDFTLFFSTFACSSLLDCSKTAEEDIGQRTVHRLTHNPGQNNTACSNQGAGNNKNIVLDNKTCGTGGKTGITVQQGNDNRHVSAADGNNRQDTKYKGDGDQHEEITVSCA